MLDSNSQSSLVAKNQTERVAVIALLVAWVISTPFLFMLIRTLAPSPDLSIFDYIAWLASQGLAPYDGSFEVNWPGNIIIHIVAQTIFGSDPAASRAFDFFIMQATIVAGAVMLWRNGMRVGAGFLLAFYPPLYITAGIWMVGQRDIVAAQLLLIAILFLASPRRGAIALMIAGALSAYAFAIRPTYLSFLAGILLLELFWPADGIVGTRRWQSAGAVFGGTVLMLLALGLLGLSTGTLVPWYEQAIRFALSCYGPQPSAQSMTGVPIELLVKSWPWITTFALGGMLAWILRNDFVLCLGAMATCALSFVVQHKGFGYHLSGLLVYLTLMMAVLADTLTKAASGTMAAHTGLFPWKAIPRPVWWAVLATFVLVCALGTAMKLRNNITPALENSFPLAMSASALGQECESPLVAQQAAAFIASTVPSSAYVLPVNCGYGAAFQARRLPASKFATSTSFGGGAQSACAIGNKFLAEYVADIRAKAGSHPGERFPVRARRCIAVGCVRYRHERSPRGRDSV